MLVDLNRFEQRQQPRDTHQIGVQEMRVSRRRLHPGVLVEMGVENKMRGNSCEIRVSERQICANNAPASDHSRQLTATLPSAGKGSCRAQFVASNDDDITIWQRRYVVTCVIN